MIDNPEFVDDKDVYKRGPIKYVGFEIWQVKSGSIFDNIILTDSKEEAISFAKDTWGKSIEKEKEMKAKFDVRCLGLSTMLCCKQWRVPVVPCFTRTFTCSYEQGCLILGSSAHTCAKFDLNGGRPVGGGSKEA
jgi:hypothetical protein